MRQFGRYKLIRQLGAGGMGKVFEAITADNRHPVAIKVISGHGASNEDARMRFVREARAAGQLHHPNIVTVHDIGQVRGTLYIVMEYLRGGPLTAFIPRPPNLSLKITLSIVARIADALGHAHSRGVVHRDVKPANVMILRDGSVKVVDFGVAGLAGLPSAIGGTLPYMSPEQLGGQTDLNRLTTEVFTTASRTLDGRSDIWSLGVTLFELVTGTLPFRSMLEIVSAPAPVLPMAYSITHGVRDGLNAVLARALAKDCRERYQTAEQLAADLRMLDDIRTVRIRSVSASSGVPLGRATDPDTDATNDSTVTMAAVSAHGLDMPGIATEAKAIPPAGMPRNYTPPDIGFKRQEHGVPEIRVEQYVWKQRKQTLYARHATLPDLLVYSSVPTLALLVLIPLYGPGLSPIFAFAPVVIVVIVWVALIAGMMVCSLAEITERTPRCRGCHLHMGMTARWTRFCKSREEVVFGYRDCVAALKHGLWQDAAKLLSLYGNESDSGYGSRLITPARYHLSFFECVLCGNHAARITMDEGVGAHWAEHARFAEAYRGTVGRPAFLSILLHCANRYPRMLAGSVMGQLMTDRVRSEAIIVILTVFALAAALLLLRLLFTLAIRH